MVLDKRDVVVCSLERFLTTKLISGSTFSKIKKTNKKNRLLNQNEEVLAVSSFGPFWGYHGLIQFIY